MAHRAHKAVHRAAKHRPSTLAKVGALLTAPVPDVELLLASMANPESGIKFVLGIARKAGKRISEVQSVIFDKLKWTADAAKQWLKDHDFTTSGKDEGATFWRFRQKPPKYREYATIIPGMRNRHPGESIASYQEHLDTTTDPKFRSATPGEQAAAMTAQDLCENPRGGFWILSYSKQLSSTPPDENDIAHGPFDLILSDTRVEILKRGKGAGEKQRFLVKADRYGKPYWGWVDRSLLYRVPAPSVSADSQAEQNPRPIVVVHIGTGVKVGDFDTREEAQRWIDGLRVSPSYKDQFYRIKTADEWWAGHPSNRGHRNPEPMGSAPMETRKLLLIDVKFAKSAEKLGRIIGVARAQGWAEVAEAAEAKAKRLKIQPETLDRHAAKIVPWRNPESAAAELYEEFHGKPPGETLEIHTDKLEHEWLTQLGLLVELKVATLTNLEATLSFDKDAPNLCSSEDGRQLYIEGGVQELDLKVLKMDGEKWLKDSMVIGVCFQGTYQTEKGFQNFKLTDYYHNFGEETGVQPFLLYDPKNQLLSISGGQYQVKPEGIVN